MYILHVIGSKHLPLHVLYYLYLPSFFSINHDSNQFIMIICFRLGVTTKVSTINPKDRSVIELYGILDPTTRDWTDGLLSNIFREINKPTDKSEKRYILFDGDVDALWVENMNSVMDDNRLLTLANGERIRLQKHCALLFEVCSFWWTQYWNICFYFSTLAWEACCTTGNSKQW